MQCDGLPVFDLEADRDTREKAADNMIVLAKVKPVIFFCLILIPFNSFPKLKYWYQKRLAVFFGLQRRPPRIDK